jgi:hemolysin III
VQGARCEAWAQPSIRGRGSPEGHAQAGAARSACYAPTARTGGGPLYKGERTNAITHGIGALLAIAGLITLIALAPDARRLVSFSIYGGTLVLVFVASTLYHSMRGPAKQLFQRVDHASIYLLIAGTYTPFALVTLPPVWGWPLLAGVTGLAATGIALDLGPRRSTRRVVRVGLALAMGWLAILALEPLVRALPPRGLLWLVAGGALYTGGVLPYAWRSLPRNHEIWHVFVLGASGCHYVAILLYV